MKHWKTQYIKDLEKTCEIWKQKYQDLQNQFQEQCVVNKALVEVNKELVKISKTSLQEEYDKIESLKLITIVADMSL